MGRAPYAPATAVLAILSQHRKTPISKFDATVLDRQVSISASLIPRTLVTLQLLGFSDEEGLATPAFAALARVPEAQLKAAVGDILRDAYEPVLAALGGDPSAASLDDLQAAFRSYNPLGQLERMIQLFTGLMAYIGMMPEVPRRRTKGGKAESAPRPRNGSGAKPKDEAKDLEKSFERTPPPLPELSPPSAYSRSVALTGGAGSITLSGTVNPFALKGASRDFVFALIDLMDDYEILKDDGEVSGEQVAPDKTPEVKS